MSASSLLLFPANPRLRERKAWRRRGEPPVMGERHVEGRRACSGTGSSPLPRRARRSRIIATWISVSQGRHFSLVIPGSISYYGKAIHMSAPLPTRRRLKSKTACSRSAFHYLQIPSPSTRHHSANSCPRACRICPDLLQAGHEEREGSRADNEPPSCRAYQQE